MPIVNVSLALDEKTYAALKSGAYELGGLVKDSNNRIRKHLPTVVDSAKEGASKAIDIVRSHKSTFIIVGGVVFVGGVVVGTVSYFTQRKKHKAAKQFSIALDDYLESAKNGLLTINQVDALISALNELENYSKDGQIPLKIPTKQLIALLDSIYDYTVRMAQANQIDSCSVHSPNRSSKNRVLELHSYLEFQRQILKQSA